MVSLFPNVSHRAGTHQDHDVAVRHSICDIALICLVLDVVKPVHHGILCCERRRQYMKLKKEEKGNKKKRY